MACSFRVVEARVQIFISREMSWLTLTAVQGSLRKAKLHSTDPLACWTGPDCEAELLRFRQALASVFLGRNLASLNPVAACVGCVGHIDCFLVEEMYSKALAMKAKFNLANKGGGGGGIRSNRRTYVVYAPGICPHAYFLSMYEEFDEVCFSWVCGSMVSNHLGIWNFYLCILFDRGQSEFRKMFIQLFSGSSLPDGACTLSD